MIRILHKGNVSVWVGLAVGALYGVAARLLFANGRLQDYFAIMTLGFVFLVRLALGVLTIKADTKSIPRTTLDEHVTIGGPYFDMLEGDYRIQQIGENQVILHLSSKHRLSTRFIFYAGLWTDFIMRDIQRNILGIIKRRCEVSP